MRADQLPDLAALVLRRIVEVDEHELGHVSGLVRAGMRAGRARAVWAFG